jgi:hypothetical protein
VAPSGTPGARLLYATPDGMELATLSANGSLIGDPVRIGPADAYSRPLWSPKGRYVAWSVATNSDVRKLELYDSAKGALAEIDVSNFDEVSGDGTGAIAASLDSGDGRLVVTRYDRAGKASTPALPSIAAPTGSLAVGHDLLVVESGAAGADSGATKDLNLIADGKARRVGQVTPVPFLGMQITPPIALAAVRSDDSQIAVATELGQDGGCAPGGTVHLIDVASGTDAAVPLPPDPAPGGDPSLVRLANASYSPDGVLGGVLSNCGFEGNDKSNVFVELHGDQWQRVLPGAIVAARGPLGLLATQIGAYRGGQDGATTLVLSAPLVVTDGAGLTTATLVPSWTAAWAPSAVAPN